MRIVGEFLNNISPSNSFLILLLPTRLHQNCQMFLAAVSIKGLKRKCRSCVMSDEADDETVACRDTRSHQLMDLQTGAD